MILMVMWSAPGAVLAESLIIWVSSVSEIVFVRGVVGGEGREELYQGVSPGPREVLPLKRVDQNIETLFLIFENLEVIFCTPALEVYWTAEILGGVLRSLFTLAQKCFWSCL